MGKLSDNNILPEIKVHHEDLYTGDLFRNSTWETLVEAKTEEECIHELRKIYWALQQFLKLEPKQ